MSAASQALLDAGIEALGWTLLHFLWQGALAGAIFALLMKSLARASAGLRYAAGLCVFAGLALTPAVTFWYVLDVTPAAVSATVSQQVLLATGAAGAAGADWWTRIEGPLQSMLPWLVLAWFAGVIVLSWRLVRDWAEVRALVRSCTRPVPASWRDIAERLRITFGIRRPVQVLESALVRVPMVIGWLKPVILIPPAALLGLTAKQLELLVAHELAHIRRLDYAVNLFQVAVETLLFYHPVVRWMSARIREERELCCDDLVVATSGDKLAYARALAEMEGLRATVPCMGMAADGGQLMSRINRLVALPAPQRGAAHWLLGILLAATGAGVMSSLHFAVGFDAPVARAQVDPQPLTDPVSDPAAATEPAVPAIAADEPTAVPAISRQTAAANVQPVVEAVVERVVEPVAEASVEPIVTDEPAPAASTPSPLNPQETGLSDAPSTAAPDAVPSKTTQPAPAGSPAMPVDPRPAPAIEEPKATTPTAPHDAEPELPRAVVDDQSDADVGTRLAMARAPVSESAATTPIEPEPVEPDPQVPAGPKLSGGTPLIVTQPDFPRRARLKGIEGAVTVEFTVTRKGRVSNVRVIDAQPAGVFDREVVESVHDWRFEPFREDGSPVARTIARTIQFQLDGSAPNAADTDCMMLTGSRLCRTNRFGSKERGVDILYRAGR